jgi:dTDP-4-dehydrorhamnose 3,5-epimerase-like enzyme
MWNDPELAIEWPVEPGDAIVSAKDQNGAAFRDAQVFA